MRIRILPLALLTVVGVALSACADEAPLAPETPVVAKAKANLPASADLQTALATLRSATARYHDLDAAIADGFVLLHPCEERPGEGPVGAVYVDPSRLDGIIDPAAPEALVYEPARNGRFKLVAAEFAVPYIAWSEPDPPEFMGAVFQPEGEFGVYGLHIWIWRHNPEGMFAEANPRVSCDAA
jgi:hypothetical protein